MTGGQPTATSSLVPALHTPSDIRNSADQCAPAAHERPLPPVYAAGGVPGASVGGGRLLPGRWWRPTEASTHRVVQPGRQLRPVNAPQLAPRPREWAGQQAVPVAYRPEPPIPSAHRHPDGERLPDRTPDH